jgi:hypothetical protein
MRIIHAQEQEKIMNNKIKASELFKKLYVNSQISMAQEDSQLINKLVERGNVKYNMQYYEDMSMVNDYLRVSFIKTTILTLVELDAIEKDCDVLEANVSARLMKEAMDLIELSKQ